MRRLGMEEPIVCFSMPAMIELSDDLPSARLRLYHVMDEYSGYRLRVGESRLRLQRNEKKMMALVDLVLVVSEKLYETKSPFNPHTCIIPNGVDYLSYERSLADPRLPQALCEIPEPRLGYIGLVGEKVDVAMLKELAETHPEWSLVFLGVVNLDKQAESWRAMRALPNVHLLDPVPAPQVPDYVKGFQVGLMPYLLDLQVQNSSPLKMYDYMAAGIPIASIDMPPARPFESLICLAEGRQAFARAVGAALADQSPERREARRQLAKQHSWDARVQDLMGVIDARLAEREQTP
jgi:glycosyltransferase involved in cell wall biosynthesis